MLGSNLMRYTYNEAGAYKQGASLLAFLTLFLSFLGGYYSGQQGRWWLVFFVLIIFWLTFNFVKGEKTRAGENLVRIAVGVVIAAIFLLVFAAGYWLAPRGLWWPGLSLLAVYFILNRILDKQRK